MLWLRFRSIVERRPWVLQRRRQQQQQLFSTTPTTKVLRPVAATNNNNNNNNNSSPFANVMAAPPDAILGLTEAFQADARTNKKVIVGVGAYRDETGAPYVLPSVQQAEKLLYGRDMEYAGMAGDATFVQAAMKLLYGPTFDDARMHGIQALSGTGGLRVWGEFLARYCNNAPLYLPTPTWGNHGKIFGSAGLVNVRSYRYLDKETGVSLDWDGLLADVSDIPPGAWMLLHACAHNPTGVDPTIEQWQELSDIMLSRNIHPLFDCAYQGFASGDADRDAAAVRLFVEAGHPALATVQSFSKNFGLYGHRVGALSIVTDHAQEASNVISQLKANIVRPMYSNPPIHGARIVSTILNSAEWTEQWKTECRGMADRITSMRTALRNELEKGTDQDWSHVTSQVGMFAYSGLQADQVEALRLNHAVYCTTDGRLSMAGITEHNVQTVAHAMCQVVQNK